MDFFWGYIFGLLVSRFIPGPTYRLIIYDKGRWFPNGYWPRREP